jgi:hypothetical protein
MAQGRRKSLAPSDKQEVIRLHREEKISLRKIAARLNTSYGPVWRAVHAAPPLTPNGQPELINHTPPDGPTDETDEPSSDETVDHGVTDGAPTALHLVEAHESAMPEDAADVLPGQRHLDEVSTVAEVGDRLSTGVDIVPVTIDHLGQLSPDEAQRLDHYEHIIAQGVQTFLEVGHALMAIRDQRLYRQAYATFEDYLRERWDLSRPRAYQLIDAAQVIDTVSTAVDILPANEAQARPLASLPPAQQVEVWRQAVETAPSSGITAKHVQATAKRVKEQVSPATPPTRKPFDPSQVKRRIKDDFMAWLRRCEDAEALQRVETFLDTLKALVAGRSKSFASIEEDER